MTTIDYMLTTLTAVDEMRQRHCLLKRGTSIGWRPSRMPSFR